MDTAAPKHRAADYPPSPNMGADAERHIPRHRSTQDDPEHTILVAFTVDAPDWEQANRQLMSALPHVEDLYDGPSGITSWWVAEDVRFDGSDNDSASFVPGSGAANWPANSRRRHKANHGGPAYVGGDERDQPTPSRDDILGAIYKVGNGETDADFEKAADAVLALLNPEHRS